MFLRSYLAGLIACIPLLATADSTVGNIFEYYASDRTCSNEAIVIGQYDIDRHTLAIQVTHVCRNIYGSLPLSIEEEEKPAKTDMYRINCKESSFAILSEADGQGKYDMYRSGWYYNFTGKPIQPQPGESSTYVSESMINVFKKACK